MAASLWITRADGTVVRWRKSRSDGRPGPTRKCGAKKWYRRVWTRRERFRARTACRRGDAHGGYYLHPRDWYC